MCGMESASTSWCLLSGLREGQSHQAGQHPAEILAGIDPLPLAAADNSVQHRKTATAEVTPQKNQLLRPRPITPSSRSIPPPLPVVVRAYKAILPSEPISCMATILQHQPENQKMAPNSLLRPAAGAMTETPSDSDSATQLEKMCRMHPSGVN